MNLRVHADGKNGFLNRIFAGFGGIMALSPAVAVIVTIAVSALAVFALVASILIWPVLIRCCSSSDPEAQKVISLCIAAGVGLAISSVIAAVLAYKMDEYSFATGMLPAFFINLFACVIGISVSGLTILNPVLGSQSVSGFMDFCVQVFFALMCCILPATIAGLIGIGFRAVGHLYYNLRS